MMVATTAATATIAGIGNLMAENNVIRGIEFYRAHPMYVRATPINGHPMFRGIGRVWMTYHETRQFGSDQRVYVRYRVEANGQFYNPLSTLIQVVPETPIQTARQMAQETYPDFNWARFDELEHEAAQAVIRKLNHRPPAPIGREEPKSETKEDTRTEFEIMADNALQQTGKELVKSQEVGIQTKDDMMKAVKVAYSAGRNQLSETQIAAVALLCWELGLSPNPGLGHVYGFPSKNGFTVTVGIYGLINLARRDHEFILKDARDMTDEERKQNGLKPADVGVMVGLIDMREARNAGELAKLGVAVNINDLYHWVPGIWYSEVNRKNKETGQWEIGPEDVPNTWTPRMVAEKRGVRNALKRLGLNTNVGKLPDLKGYRYDVEVDSYVEEPQQIEDSAPPAAPEGTEAPVEAQFEELLTSQVQAEQERESVVIEQSEGDQAAPELTEPEVKAETAPEASETEATAADAEKPRDLRSIYATGKLGTDEIKEVPKAARIVAMLQTQVKPAISQDTASSAVKALITNSTLNHVTTEEWRGLLAVINAKPTADEIQALVAAEKAEA